MPGCSTTRRRRCCWATASARWWAPRPMCRSPTMCCSRSCARTSPLPVPDNPAITTASAVITEWHAGQAEMVAQGRALVVAPEQAAALQFRHDAIDEIGEAAGEMRRQDVEPIGRPLDEPFLQRVGDPARRAAEHPVAARRRGQIVEIAQRHVLAPRHLVQRHWRTSGCSAPAAAAGPARRADGRTRRSRSGWRPGSWHWSA